MSYPKPLSEKSLNRLYMQAGLSTETCAFLHSLFAACANLYGTIALRDVWSVYQELKSDVPRIHRRDLIAFSAIVRREVQPYRVYEIEELYTEEPHNDLDRHIVSKELIGAVISHTIPSLVVHIRFQKCAFGLRLNKPPLKQQYKYCSHSRYMLFSGSESLHHRMPGYS